MNRWMVLAVLAGAMAGGVGGALAVAPGFVEHDGSLRITARDYGVELSPAGALLAVVATTPSGEMWTIGPEGAPHSAPGVVYRATRPVAAWVLRAGESWNSGGTLPVSRTVETDGNELVVSYRYAGTGGASTLEVVAEYRFAASREFTLTGSVRNVAGPAVELVAFPAPLTVDGAPLQQVVFPWQRGVVALPPATSQQLSTSIPSGFTNFVAFESANGVFAVSEPVTPQPALDHSLRLALYRSTESNIESLGYHIDRTMALAAGTTWTSGTTLFQVGRTTVEAARRHWDLGATGSYPTLREKLAAETFDRLARSVQFKFPDGLGDDARAAAMAALPVPSLLHLCSYMPGGHDSNYPDYLPPDPRFGTMEQFRAFVVGLRARGVLVMPYTNPTWWDTNSPTIQRLGLDVAMRDAEGNPRIETYHGKSGVVVNPEHPAVRERLAQNFAQFAAELPVDMIFEDQIGARDAIAGAPGFSAGLVENARTAAVGVPLMTEGGWDRLAEMEAGFCGNGRIDWEQPHLPAGTWLPYPLLPVMANEHTATYPHNLAGEYMIHNREELLYNVALGVNLAYDLNRGLGEWMPAAVALQARVLYRTFGQRVVEFDDQRRGAGTTRLVYTNGDQVLANWGAAPVAWRGMDVQPRGFVYTTADLSLVAGYFDAQGRLTIRENGEVTVLMGGQ